MNNRIISIFIKNDTASRHIAAQVTEKMKAMGLTVQDKMDEQTELLICVGGDGTTLQAIHEFDFPTVPIVGINTGHLGFFQEVLPENIDRFIELYLQGKFSLQPASAVQAIVTGTNATEGAGTFVYKGFNEIVLRGAHSYTAHYDISIGGSFIERFSGDGLLVATSTGSTAYNYSLGGSIVDPRLKLLQMTPIAPMNTTAYRSFTSSLLLPPDLSLGIKPEVGKERPIMVVNDGIEHVFQNVTDISVTLADTEVNLVRFANYDFWGKVKSKFI